MDDKILDPKDFNTLKEFQELVDRYEFHSLNEIRTKFPLIWNKLDKMEFKKQLKFKERDLKYGSYKTKEDFQRYILDNNIKSPKDFFERNRKLYDWMSHLRLTRSVIYPEAERLKEEYENSLPVTREEFQKFIDDNKITGTVDFRSRFTPIYKRLKAFKLNKKVYYYGEIGDRKRFLDSFKTKEDFQKYVDDNNIKSPQELENHNEKVYRRLKSLRLCNYINYGDSCKRGSYILMLSELNNNPDKIKEYIRLNNITSRKEFKKKDLNVYKRFLALSDEVKDTFIFPNDPPKKRKFSSLAEIQDFIIEKKILSLMELRDRFSYVYRRYKKFKKESLNKEIIFPKYGTASSLQEMMLIRDLIRYGQTNFELHLSLRDKENNIYFYDCYFPLLKLLIEDHGPQHFNNKRPDLWKYRDEIENDKNKYKLAVEKGYTLRYIVYDAWRIYENCGYFQPVYRSVPDLFSSIGIEVKENPNYEQDFMNLFSDDFINLINKICKGFEIHNQEELNKFDNLSWLISEFNLYDKIIYYKEEEQDLQE